MKSTIRKKTYDLDEKTIESVRRLFDVKTETEAVQKALEAALEHHEIRDSLDRLLREGRFRTVYR